jgi:hypothetical protein
MDVGYFRTVSGTVLDLALPLTDAYAQQVTKHQLVRVADADGNPYEGDADGPAEGAQVTERPAVAASKASWVGYALHCDPDLNLDDAEAMTKQDLIEKYGSKGS